MESYEAFYNFYGEGYEDTLPRELVEAYDIVECLSCVEGCDTLLLKQKSTGKKMVAKCYTEDSTLPGQTEDAQLENIRSLSGFFQASRYYDVFYDIFWLKVRKAYGNIMLYLYAMRYTMR